MEIDKNTAKKLVEDADRFGIEEVAFIDYDISDPEFHAIKDRFLIALEDMEDYIAGVRDWLKSEELTK